MATTNSTLQLDRSLQNYAFENWKIGNHFVQTKTECQLPGDVYMGAADALDFAHNRVAALCNHLVVSQGRIFLATTTALDTLVISEVLGKPLLESTGVPALETVGEVGISSRQSSRAPVAAALDCSLAVLATPQHVAAAEQNSAADAGTLNSAAKGALRILFSSGKGDLFLITRLTGQAGRVSPPVYPLLHQPTASSTRPFLLHTAWVNKAGAVRAVLSCLVDSNKTDSSSNSSSQLATAARGSRQRHQQSSWVCETWLVTLSIQDSSGQEAPQLQVLGCQLLHVTPAPPAGAVACAAADMLLLASEPRLEPDELPPAYQQHMAEAMAMPDEDIGTATPSNNLQTAAAAVAHCPSENRTAGGTRAADDTMNDGMNDAMDDDSDDMSPRTLAAAAARLAQFTSDTHTGDLPQQQWSDVFRESGPGELGTEGSDTAVDLVLFGPTDAPTSSSSNGATAAAVPGVRGGFTVKFTASCGPHKLLAAEQLLQVGQGMASAVDGGVLMGLTDDVDCAVVAASVNGCQPLTSTEAAAAEAVGAAAAGPMVLNGGISSSVLLQHTAFLPAIAYVVAGKTQRRHFLLASHPSSPVCCVLVEATKYTYLYGQVPQGSQHGQQQIFDMELASGECILGARLVTVCSNGVICCQEIGPRRHEADSTGSVTLLLLLTQSRLLCCRLQKPGV